MSMLKKIRHCGVLDLLPTARELLQHAVKIRAQNVADYYWASEQTHWRYREDFPNIAPPWQLAWFEWRRPRTTEDGFTAQSADVGALLIAKEVNDQPISRITGDRVRWECQWLVCVEHERDILVGMVQCTVSTEGRAIPLSLEADGRGHYAISAVWPQKLSSKNNDIVCLAAMNELNAALLTLCFANCSNTKVAREPTAVIKPAVLRKHPDKKPVEWHCLEIGGTRQLIERVAAESADKPTSLRQRLHLARGHFKSFEQGKGLFGKHHGLYWWHQQVRGNRAAGIVLKDYQVKEGAQ